MIRCLALAGLLIAAAWDVRAAGDRHTVDIPAMEFVPPAPGSYKLERIQRATDGSLLDSAGQTQQLSALTSGKVSLISFFYTYCVDPWGCPFTYATLTSLRNELRDDPWLSARVRFLNISFDPSHDTPAALATYGREFINDPQFEWRFLTARNVPELLPILDGFGQDVSVETDATGQPTRTMFHMVKMFLIDGRGMVREIYNLSTLHPQVMLNDIKTLLIEERGEALGPGWSVRIHDAPN